jgi:hypothetical protein
VANADLDAMTFHVVGETIFPGFSRSSGSWRSSTTSSSEGLGPSLFERLFTRVSPGGTSSSSFACHCLPPDRGATWAPLVIENEPRNESASEATSEAAAVGIAAMAR